MNCQMEFWLGMIGGAESFRSNRLVRCLNRDFRRVVFVNKIGVVTELAGCRDVFARNDVAIILNFDPGGQRCLGSRL